MKMISSEFTCGPTRIHYIEKGCSENVLLFIHDWGCNSSYWSQQVAYFSRTYRAIAMDLPGFGRSCSAQRAWTVEDFSRDVSALIEGLQIKNVILVGHAAACDIIVETALSRQVPVAGLIGVESHKITSADMGSMARSMQSDFKNTVSQYADRFLFHPATDSLARIRVKLDLRNTDPHSGIPALRNQISYKEKLPSRLSELEQPLYLINSDRTPTDLALLEKNCKRSFDVVYIPATGHFPMIEKPSKFNRLLEVTLHKITLTARWELARQ
ncbi:MAG: alpha/beta hydrolase [Bacteroidota bacterium]